jgi:hypothetical protein
MIPGGSAAETKMVCAIGEVKFLILYSAGIKRLKLVLARRVSKGHFSDK